MTLGGFFLLHACVRLLEPLLREHVTGRPIDLSRFESLRGDPLALLLGLLVVWSVAAFGEEMVFRGYVLSRTARLLSPSGRGAWTGAVAISSLIFGLGQILSRIAQGGFVATIPALLLGFQAFLGGILLGYIYLRAKNIWPPAILHVGMNLYLPRII